MAEQPLAAPQGPAQQSDPTKVTQPPGDATRQPPPKAEERAPDFQALAKDVSDKLRQALPSIAEADKAVAQSVESVLRQLADPIRTNQRGFQHELAYTVQEVERARGVRLPLADEAKSELTKLAGSAPGLENERMRDLMRSTATIEDKVLVRDIRRAAIEVGQQTDQNTSSIRSQIDVLENRARLTPRSEAAVAGEATDLASTGRPSASGTRDGGADQASQGQGFRRQDEAARQNPPHFLQGAGTDPMNAFFRTLRGGGSGTTPPWEAAPTPFGPRLSAFEDKMLQGRDDLALRGVAKSGRAAIEALEGFKNGEGAVMLNRIREAARSDPAGMPACCRR
jgi:hypothetical protein